MSEKWCGKHRAAKPGLCPEHGGHWYELHNGELEKNFSVAAVFYCPVYWCDEIEIISGYRSPFDSEHRSIERNIQLLAARQKVLFHKLALREGDGK